MDRKSGDIPQSRPVGRLACLDPYPGCIHIPKQPHPDAYPISQGSGIPDLTVVNRPDFRTTPKNWPVHQKHLSPDFRPIINQVEKSWTEKLEMSSDPRIAQFGETLVRPLVLAVLPTALIIQGTLVRTLAFLQATLVFLIPVHIPIDKTTMDLSKRSNTPSGQQFSFPNN
ncbi:unnamed protein product [Caenorhabditis nigoni]